MRTVVAMLAIALGLALGLAAGARGLEPVAGEILGVWQEVGVADGPGETLEITAQHCAVAIGGELDRLDPLVGVEGDVLVRSVRGEHRQRFRFSVADDVLSLVAVPEEGAVAAAAGGGSSPAGTSAKVPPPRPQPEAPHVRRYRRLAERPPCFDLTPSPLGPRRPLAGERLAAVKSDLARRLARDREAREALKTPQPSAALRQRLASLDRDQASWLRQLVAEIGWIDADRFGKEAALAAFRIAQHGGDLRLLAAVLPEIRRDAEELGIAPEYAVLHDRTWLRLGRKQIYGTRVAFERDGSAVVLPMDDPSGVEQRRRALGLPSFGQYLEILRGYGDEGRTVSIRKDF